MVKGISKLVMGLTVRLTCVKGKVKSDSRFDLSFAKDQMCSKSNFSSRVKIYVSAYVVPVICAPISNQIIEFTQAYYPHLQCSAVP